MDEFERIVRDIKSVKIQGAESIAAAAVKALNCRCSRSKASSCKAFFCEIDRAKRELFATRPTEPLMRNVLNYVISSLKKEEGNATAMKKDLNKICSDTLCHFEMTRQKIAELGAKKIDNGSIVFTHCHSSTVMRILKKAKAQGKRFEVYNTEARPLLQGRITAKELAASGIKVTHFVDSAANVALSECDVAFFGFDAVTSDGVYNKIGSGMFALAAKKQGVPLFACGDSWKFDADNLRGKGECIEARSPKEVWPAAPRGVKINNPCFEIVEHELITGIISELGIYKYRDFIACARKAYPWLCK